MNTLRDRWVLPSGFYLDRVIRDNSFVFYHITSHGGNFFNITKEEFDALQPLGRKIE